MKIESAISKIPIYNYNSYTLYFIILCTMSLLALNDFVRQPSVSPTMDANRNLNGSFMPFGHLFF